MERIEQILIAITKTVHQELTIEELVITQSVPKDNCMIEGREMLQVGQDLQRRLTLPIMHEDERLIRTDINSIRPPIIFHRK